MAPPSTPTSLARALEDQGWAERLAEPLQRPLQAVLERQGGLRSLLDGSWLGHPVHAAVTDLPVGAWASGFVLDAAHALGVRRDLTRASDAVQAIGLVGALAAAVFGLADWSYTGGGARRLGLIALSSTGFAVLLFSTWLGGELSYRHGIGVSRGAFEDESEDWTRVAGTHDICNGGMLRAEAAGTAVLLARVDGQLYAIGDTCTHMGCSLAEGRMEGEVVICPCHDSHFRITDGEVVKGPASTAVTSYEVRTHVGQIEVRRAALNRA